MAAIEKLTEHNNNLNLNRHFHAYAKDITLMALIHSRIKEVYYYQKRVIEGRLNNEL